MWFRESTHIASKRTARWRRVSHAHSIPDRPGGAFKGKAARSTVAGRARDTIHGQTTPRSAGGNGSRISVGERQKGGAVSAFFAKYKYILAPKSQPLEHTLNPPVKLQLRKSDMLLPYAASNSRGGKDFIKEPTRIEGASLLTERILLTEHRRF